jgi:hypothetical protein
LLSELESIQKKSRFVISDKEKRVISRSKRQELSLKYGEGLTLVVALVVRYVDNDEDLRNILLINKDINTHLKNAVYKQALLRTDRRNLRHKRTFIWENILKFVRNHSFNNTEIENARLLRSEIEGVARRKPYCKCRRGYKHGCPEIFHKAQNSRPSIAH